MPGTGALAGDEKWVITIEVEGARTKAESDKVKKSLDRLVKRLSTPKKQASWKGKDKAK
jgi:hypothetical protein